ncbi:Spt4/RpoE2 zinc finger-domain-containing protein [Syncephalis pseudoplumigaleata]|uniref:Transcription elongation factor SPT4 n=1 Tax=Syncephalis pseudoplumigaleata TaxID=1712513 RepID=A0A4V1J1N4_9FUNG|nr:Spt4/RpoE2 zinc finger-domain-containing protein [Syncephalis pseudoplumigaleata]|eukprot:RKP25669.1 Spt4/RpoE2 zinc finger-domain-containing protein [Syncephalis pseudoplumigaleata]
MADILPANRRQLRACLLCGLIKQLHQFRNHGCENCEELMRMRVSLDRVNECTTTNFEGAIAVIKPEDSWATQWLRLERFRPGVYAIRVTGMPPDDVLDELERRNITFIPRDGSMPE